MASHSSSQAASPPGNRPQVPVAFLCTGCILRKPLSPPARDLCTLTSAPLRGQRMPLSQSSNCGPGPDSVSSKDHRAWAEGPGGTGGVSSRADRGHVWKRCMPRAAPVWCSAQHVLGWRLRNWGNQVPNAGGSQMRGPSWCSAQGKGREGREKAPASSSRSPRCPPPPGKDEWPPDAALASMRRPNLTAMAPRAAVAPGRTRRHPETPQWAAQGGRLRTQRSWPLRGQAP